MKFKEKKLFEAMKEYADLWGRATNSLFISSLGCEEKFSIKTQELTPKGGCTHIWKIMWTWNTLWIVYLFKAAQNTKTYKRWKKNKKLRNQPLLNDKHVFFYTNSRAKTLDATQKKKTGSW